MGPLLDLLEAFRPYRILLVSDGAVSTEARHPTSGSVPMVVAGEGIKADEAPRWDEEACALGSLAVVRPWEARTLL